MVTQSEANFFFRNAEKEKNVLGEKEGRREGKLPINIEDLKGEPSKPLFDLHFLW